MIMQFPVEKPKGDLSVSSEKKSENSSVSNLRLGDGSRRTDLISSSSRYSNFSRQRSRRGIAAGILDSRIERDEISSRASVKRLPNLNSIFCATIVSTSVAVAGR